jgi:toxin ParE1/3/4
MAEFKLTNKAIADLANIWNYTFDTWSENQADKYYEMLISAWGEIAANPTRGKIY